MRAGSVVVVNFPGVNGLKRRPAIVISSDLYHSNRPDVILALITSQITKSNSETDYTLRDWSNCGLNKPSAVRMFLSTRPKQEASYIGELSEFDWSDVKKRINISIEF